MHLYCLKILLTISLCNSIPCLFQLNFVFFFFWHIFFSGLIPSFLFFMPSKRAQNLFTTLRHILDAFFILVKFISIVTYTVYTSLLTLTCLYLFTLTYLYLCSRQNFLDWRVVLVLKIIIQRQPPAVFYKNFAIFTGKQLCWSLLLLKLQAISPASLQKRGSNRGVLSCAHCDFFKNSFFYRTPLVVAFWKTSAYSCFWLIFSFGNLFIFGCLFMKKKNYDLLWWRKC